MQTTTHFPIVFKLVFLTSLIVVAVAMVIAWKNSELFSQISTDREETSAEMITSSKALEVEAVLESYVEKLSTFAEGKDTNRVLSGDLSFYQLDSVSSGRFELTNPNAPEDIKNVLQNFSGHEGEIQNGRVFISSTGKLLKEPYLVIGAPVAKENGFVTHWAWGVFRLNKLQASFGNQGQTLYLLDNQGQVLVHSDEAKTIQHEDYSSNKFVGQFLKEDIRKKQQYQEGILYSTSRTVFGPVVVSETKETSILAPSRLAKETSYFILGIVLSLSFFITFVFSQGLSKNLERLTDFAHEIALGNFDFRAQDSIRSKDEIGVLAQAFDDMTDGLKERDKIKNMFTKFHGTVITDTLMNQEDMRKGKQCEAVVFFSDIRGFTDFSNHKSPEEVVEMLNSYFEVMVGIINKHGGVVDKFVGDAIMAVWGAPNGTPDDAKNALMACLEMRKALASYNERRMEEGHTPIMMGMGLHAGPVVAGTVGSNDRLEYTVIGDTVNTASRIESATKSFGTDLLVSEEVLNRVGDQFIAQPAGSTKVKGKSDALKLAKISGFVDEDGTTHIVSTPYSQYEAEESDKVKIVA